MKTKITKVLPFNKKKCIPRASIPLRESYRLITLFIPLVLSVQSLQRECLTTVRAYVAIHHSKALSLSNVRCLFLSIFIKGIRRNLRLKSSAFSEHFHSKGKDPLKNVGFTLSDVPNPLKFVSSVQRRAVFNRT